MFEITRIIANLIYQLEKLGDLSMYGESEKIVTRDLINRINLTAENWEKEIRKNFDKWFIKHANIEVLHRKKNEVMKE